MALILTAVLWESFAQEFDTVISSRNRRAYTVLDQVEDLAERQALLALFDQRETKEKARLAEKFLAMFPRSWLLAQVYEMAAKAFIDLGDFERAVNHGRQSLKLLPENPLLLVPLANVQVQQSRLTEARISARQALIFLDEFAPPLAVPSAQWPELHRQLKASCHFVLGRAAVTEALSLSSGERRTALLRESEEHLEQARILNPQDAEIVYLLGLSQLSAGQAEAAAISFAAAYQFPGTLQSKAQEQVKRLYKARSQTISFDSFLAQLLGKAQTRPPAISNNLPGETPAQTSIPLEYAGAEACRQCHAEQHQNWQHTGMARMFRSYDPKNVIGDFDQKQPFYAGDMLHWHGNQLKVVPGTQRFVYARMFKERGRHYFQIRQADGQWVRYPVDYTIGSKWQQAYATRLPNGQIHVFPIQYNAIHRRWLNFWEVIDPEGSERADVRAFERFTATTSYQANCAVCHTSQLRNMQGGSFEADHLEFREAGINCEMCHGPSARHAAAMRRGQPYQKMALEPPVDFSSLSSQQYVAICGQCHRQSAVRDPGPNGELNYWPGAPFYPPNKSRPYAEFSRKAFYKDGRFRETTFIVESLQRSACFKRGQAHCGNCHDVHGEAAEMNPKSLRFRQEPDRMCTQCHGHYATQVKSHTRHAAGAAASRCVSCHMPPIMNSLLFRARTHQIDDVPDASTHQRFGQEESPNACLLCHTEKDSAWLAAELRVWRGTNR
ncbi:MAG: tetratricopeptide repeat protein [Acidobacteria bacterium]|nr:tetratricopeptide repeat protein [Acidobacteriota bacterium]